MTKFGSGFNRWYADNYNGRFLDIPDRVSHLELGMGEYQSWASKKNKFNGALSLHLARTPVVEDEKTQKIFVDYLFKILCAKEYSKSKISSIGLHLIGDRYHGIGRLGFSTHFSGRSVDFERANRFISMLMDKFKIPIWIENANFYSPSSAKIFQTWEVVVRILEKTGAGLILDISHLFIDSVNSNLSPEMVLGAIPQKFISEIHLSGIVKSENGVYHDGHSVAISDEIWRLFSFLLKNLVNSDQNIVYTIEHTDPVWIMKKEEFQNDFNKLHQMVINKEPSPCSVKNNSEEYAKSYLKKLLKGWSRIELSKLEALNMDFNFIFNSWLASIINDDKRVVLTKEEIPPEEWKDVHFAKESFSNFIAMMAL